MSQAKMKLGIFFFPPDRIPNEIKVSCPLQKLKSALKKKLFCPKKKIPFHSCTESEGSQLEHNSNKYIALIVLLTLFPNVISSGVLNF